MSWAFLARWEWLLIEGAVLGLAVYEFVSISRTIRRDRERAADAATREPPSLDGASRAPPRP